MLRYFLSFTTPTLTLPHQQGEEIVSVKVGVIEVAVTSLTSNLQEVGSWHLQSAQGTH